MFKTPKELGLTGNAGLDRAIGFVAAKIEKREFKFSVGYTETQFKNELTKLLKDKNWSLQEDAGTWKLTPIV